MQQQIRIETLLAKFGVKAPNLSQTSGKGLMSIDEQLALVGLSWKESPVGWLVLMSEVCNDQSAQHQLFNLVKEQAMKKMRHWRGVYSGETVNALVMTAIDEVTNLSGHLCGECNGTAQIKQKRQARLCPSCTKGRIEWCDIQRFSIFTRFLQVPYYRFSQFSSVFRGLTAWMCKHRTAALLSLQQRIERELMVH